MTNLGTVLERFYRRISWQEIVGLVLLALAAAHFFVIILPLRSEMANLHRLISEAKQHQEHRPGREDQTTRLQAYQEAFPSRSDAVTWIAHMHSLGEREQLSLPRGDYRRVASGEPPAALRIQLPVKGSYRQIRKFITAVLADIPMLALDNVSFQRQASRDALLEAHIQFTLYTKAD